MSNAAFYLGIIKIYVRFLYLICSWKTIFFINCCQEPDILLESIQLLQSLSKYRQYLRDLPAKTIMDILSEVRFWIRLVKCVSKFHICWICLTHMASYVNQRAIQSTGFIIIKLNEYLEKYTGLIDWQKGLEFVCMGF